MLSKALIYARISDDANGEAEAVTRRQIPDCLAYCEANGLEVLGEPLVDNDLSASRYARKPRPAYERLMDALRASEAAVVVVWHLDRLYRQPRELEDLLDLAERGAITVRTLSGDYDLTNQEHVFMVRLMVNIAAKESADKSRRITRKHQQLAEDGKPKGGQRGFGYDADWNIIPAEAEALQYAARQVLDGRSLMGICEQFNEQGITTTQGARWINRVLRRTLLQARIAGLREHKGKTYPAVWEPILDRDTWERVVAVLQNPARVTNGGVVARRWPYSGFVKCGRCGSRLVVGKINGQPGMSCRKGTSSASCGALTIKLEPLAELIRESAFHLILNAPSVLAELAREDDVDHSAVLSELQAERERLDHLQTEFWAGDSGLSKGKYQELVNLIESRIAKLTATVSVGNSKALVSDGLPTTLEGLRTAWESSGLDWQRALLGLIYNDVVVLPADHKGQRFTPKRVRLNFADAVGS
ncbi:MAG: Resolvase domain protein [Ilumatobacteraceae bacterium]|nr:Resolvase domain protein [Ilumatobacteraceae bacterium]